MTDYLDEKLKHKLRPILRDHTLAKFGDTLINFIYSLAKTRVFDKPFGERVFDNSLAEAIKSLHLRELLPSNISSGEIGDGAEALLGYAYLNKLMTIEEMTQIVVTAFDIHPEENYTRNQEKKVMSNVFEVLLKEILNKLKELD